MAAKWMESAETCPAAKARWVFSLGAVAIAAIALLLPMAARAAAAPVFSGFETQLTTNSGDQYDPAISGNLVVFTDYRALDTDVWYVDLSTGLEHPVTVETGNQELTDVSNGVIVYTDYTTADVLVFNTVDGTTQNLTNAAHSAALDPAISLGLVAWTDDRNHDDEIYARDLATGEERRISNSPDADQNPKVGGKVIAWHRCTGGFCDIFAYDWATGVTTQITNTPAADERSPDVDGHFLVYQGNRDGQWDIFLYDLATHTETQLSLPGDQGNPHISGDFVAYDDGSSGQRHIGLWHIPSGNHFQVTTSESVQFGQYLNDIDGNRIVYTDDRNGNLDIFMFTFQVQFPQPQTCRQAVLEAAKTYKPTRWTDADELLSPAMSFAIPAEIPVTAGSAGNQWLTLGFGGGWHMNLCWYRAEGAAGHDHHEGDEGDHGSKKQPASAVTKYLFDSCWNRSVAGQVVTTDQVWMRVNGGDSKFGDTRVKLVLDEVAPCATVVMPTDCQHLGNATPLLDATFERGCRSPHTVTVPFLAVKGPGLVCVDNGPAGRFAVTSGELSLNHTQLIGNSDWKAQLELPAPLENLNVLSVKIAGKPGSAARVRIFGLASGQVAFGKETGKPMHPSIDSKLYGGYEPQTQAEGCSQSGTGLASMLVLLFVFAALLPRRALAVRIRS